MIWPESDEEFGKAARDVFLTEMVNHTKHWFEHARDLVENPDPENPLQRNWERYMEFRKTFATMSPDQKKAVLEVLWESISGAVFSALCTLDQFPDGGAELWIWDGPGGKAGRKARIVPAGRELHDEYYPRLRAEE
jgi:hypothetical protein